MAGMSLAIAHDSRINATSLSERTLPAAPDVIGESVLVVTVVVPSADVVIVTVVAIKYPFAYMMYIFICVILILILLIYFNEYLILSFSDKISKLF